VELAVRYNLHILLEVKMALSSSRLNLRLWLGDKQAAERQMHRQRCALGWHFRLRVIIFALCQHTVLSHIYKIVLELNFVGRLICGVCPFKWIGRLISAAYILAAHRLEVEEVYHLLSLVVSLLVETQIVCVELHTLFVQCAIKLIVRHSLELLCRVLLRLRHHRVLGELVLVCKLFDL